MVKGNNLRLFFAIELEPDIKSKLLAVQDRLNDIEGKPVNGANFHITLSFLGKVAEKNLELILDGLFSSTQNKALVAPFEVTLKEVIYWSKPNIVAASIEDKKGHLGTLKKHIENALTDIGHFQFDRKSFKPHVTLFRHVEEPPVKSASLDIPVEISRFSLLESVQNRNGVQYDAIETWPLKHSSIKQQLLGR